MKKEKLFIIKIGGQIIDDPEKLANTLQSFAAISAKKILVHGGGKSANQFLEKMGIKPRLVDGRRITDAGTLDVVQMVYAGLINKNIVARLQSYGLNALGLSGADANSILAKKRTGHKIDYGFAGDVKKVNSGSIKSLLEAGFTPVFCALTHDGRGQMLNTNADTIASAVSARMAKKYRCQLVYCFEKNGVLLNLKSEQSLIKNINSANYEILKKQKAIIDGMIPKIDNAFAALNGGAEKVIISHFENIAGIEKKIKGTRISLK